MTPQLMQAIKLLQLSNLDLVSYVEAELERNPLLDRGSDAEAPSEAAAAAPEPDAYARHGWRGLGNGATVADHPADHRQ